MIIEGQQVCDRCLLPVEAFGVLHGMITVGIDEGGDILVERIFCYANGCRDIALDQMIPSPESVDPTDERCDRCGEEIGTRSVASALLAVDLDHQGVQRSMTFCHVNGCSVLLLTQAHAPPRR